MFLGYCSLACIGCSLLAFTNCAAWVMFQQSLPNRRNKLGLEVQPLIGGPQWLKVHVKCVLALDGDFSAGAVRCHKFDFVPRNATSPSTLRNLVLMRSVPADARYFPPRDPSLSETEKDTVEKAKSFCESYGANADLHPISNNCWTFAFEIYRYMHNLLSRDG